MHAAGTTSNLLRAIPFPWTRQPELGIHVGTEGPAQSQLQATGNERGEGSCRSDARGKLVSIRLVVNAVLDP